MLLFRVKMCTDVTMEDLVKVYHQMGSIQYFLQYTEQPTAFKGAPNPGKLLFQRESESESESE